MAVVLCCGTECGQAGLVGQHFKMGTSSSIVTAAPRNGARNWRANPSASTQGWISSPLTGGTVIVGRVYMKITSAPTTSKAVAGSIVGVTGTPECGLYYNTADSKWYASIEDGSLSATGLTLTTGVWHRVDWRINCSADPWVLDVQVDGDALSTSKAVAASTITEFFFMGNGNVANSFDLEFDDLLISQTSGDYPLGAGYVNHFVPTADGAHNVAGANDFENQAGTDITNATTTAYQLIDDVPLKALTPTEYINMIAPPNATDYTEHVFGPAAGISTPTAGPRGVEVIALVAQAGTGNGNMELRLNDNGSMGTIYTATGVSGIVAGKYVRAHFADPPSAASVWNANNDGGNGDFRDLRVRFGSPAALDVNPDQYLASIMIEAEFVEVPANPRFGMSALDLSLSSGAALR